MSKLSTLFLSLLGIVLPQFIQAQCCSTGNPVGASVQMGILEKNTLRIGSFYRHSYLDSYYEGSEKLSNWGVLSNSSYNFANLSLGYGITHRVTLEADAGYFIDKTQHFKNIPDYVLKGSGITGATLLFKYSVYFNEERAQEITAGAGLKIPFTSEPQYVDGVKLPVEIQPSSGAMGYIVQVYLNKGFPDLKLKIFNMNRFEYNFENKQDYRFGSFLTNSLFVSKQIIKQLNFVIELRNELKSKDYISGAEVINTGSHTMVLVPRLVIVLPGDLYISALYDIPVYRNYTGKQLGLKSSFAISITKDFKHLKFF